jgi:hypothetical protein
MAAAGDRQAPEPCAVQHQRHGAIAIIERECRQGSVTQVERAVYARIFDADAAGRRAIGQRIEHRRAQQRLFSSAGKIRDLAGEDSIVRDALDIGEAELLERLGHAIAPP